MVKYVDNNISASAYSRKRRAAYRAMLEAVRSGQVGRVVVYHIDRLYRQPRELEDWIDLADRGQVEIRRELEERIGWAGADRAAGEG